VDSIEQLLEELLRYGHEVLSRTPNMLPELKAAGVVDAGGRGLLMIFEGALNNMYGPAEEVYELGAVSGGPANLSYSPAATASSDIKFGYCTEFFINTTTFSESAKEKLQGFLESIGDSLVLVADEDIVKIHVHTDHPGSVLEGALQYGSLSSLKIENMRMQHTSMINFSIQSAPVSTPPKEVGFVAVAAGAGLKDLFLNLGADEIIEGGQTMNPSTEDVLRALERVNAKTVFILPNNKNIILAAEQAAQLIRESSASPGKAAVVIPSRSIPQGLACLISYTQSQSPEENLKIMSQALRSVHTGQVTGAVRDTLLNGKEIHKCDYLCLLDEEIYAASAGLQEGAKALLNQMVAEGPDVISIYYGQDASREQAEEMGAYVNEISQDCEVDIYNGGQPLYHYIISAE